MSQQLPVPILTTMFCWGINYCWEKQSPKMEPETESSRWCSSSWNIWYTWTLPSEPIMLGGNVLFCFAWGIWAKFLWILVAMKKSLDFKNQDLIHSFSSSLLSCLLHFLFFLLPTLSLSSTLWVFPNSVSPPGTQATSGITHPFPEGSLELHTWVLN